MRIGIIGGSGIEGRLAETLSIENARRVRPETPYGPPGSEILTGEADGSPIAVLRRHGEGHTLPPHRVPYRANVYALKLLGVTHIVATGAVGSLREHLEPGHLALCDQFIDRTVARERTFFDDAAVHVELADPVCPVTRRWLLSEAGNCGTAVHERGTYVAIEGPSFSTRAESHMHRALGADVVGMTALPEARLAREAEMAYALVALITDYDCWRSEGDAEADGLSEREQRTLLDEIIANLGRATDAAAALVAAAVSNAAALRENKSPAHSALRQAIWTDRDTIDRSATAHLDPIWRHRLDP